MRYSQNLLSLSGKGKYLVGSILLLFTAAVCTAFSMTSGDDFAIARREILLRRIGHELLLKSGDSTSRVLPVKRVADNEYQISFEKELTFQAESLVNITRDLLAKDPLSSDYVVKVLNGNGHGVAYGYAISKDRKDDIIACIGRKQPKASYIVTIKFKQTSISTVKSKLILSSLPLLAFIGLLLLKPAKQRMALSDDEPAHIFTLGPVLFDAYNRKLVVKGETIELTGTENRVLRVLAMSPNETIERSRLQKEIWEDEGVIVGRSLDMFISKLRKKLELESGVNIVVIRSKGYKLEINS
ncbi:MAG: winged helix-turn-helix domain-containing protein [Bacteroidota bacterium]